MATISRQRVLLDASALIAVIADEPVAARVAGLLAMLDRGEAELVESVLIFGEVFRPSDAKDPIKRREQNAKLAAIRARLESREVVLLDVTAPVVRKATEFRLSNGLKLPDAVHLATAVLNRCDWLVTLDRDFPQLPGVLKVFRLEDLTDPKIMLPWDATVQTSLFDEGGRPDNVIEMRIGLTSGGEM